MWLLAASLGRINGSITIYTSESTNVAKCTQMYERTKAPHPADLCSEQQIYPSIRLSLSFFLCLLID